jgi:uncharacterized protein YndB with AHSA1/START domain
MSEKGHDMTDTNEALGTIEHRDGRYHARLERHLEHPPAAVWAMLTEPDRMIDWLAPGEIELKEGGAAKLNFVDSGIVIDSTVTAFEPERVLEYSWSGPGEPDRPVRYEIEPDGDGSCAGWEAHLMMLLAAIEGVPIKFPFERFQSTREIYNSQVAAGS